MDRVFVGIRRVSGTKFKCVCMPRDSGKLLGCVDGTDVADSQGYGNQNADIRDIGAFVYRVYRK